MSTVISGGVTFIDVTDNRKLEAYITSNFPISQIYDQNEKTYNPNWVGTNLRLSADIYLDSKNVNSDSKTSIIWYEKIGTSDKTPISANSTFEISGNTLIIKANRLSSENKIITYICEAKYKDDETNPPTAYAEITFTRVDTGLNGSNGSNGSDAPAVVAQYSANGSTGWTTTLNTSTHKYIRHSYDGGKTWSAAIKMVGEDGTSVRIMGTATSATKVSGTDYYTLVYSSSSITNAELGDAYLYNGNLYVCADSRDGQDYFINVGNIQGPSGNDGKSSYVFIRYATDSNGANMSTSPTGKTYMGVYTSDTNVAPTTASSYTWSKFVGDSAKSIVLSGESQVFKISKSSVVTPSTIKVTAQAFNTTVTTWTYSTNGGQTFLSTVPDGVSRNGNIVTVTGSSITSNSITIKASDGTIEDVFTIYKAFDGIDGNPGDPGAPAPIVFLTNENVTFSANAQGQIAGTTITSNIVAYNGTTKVTPTIGTISGAPTGMTITSSTIVASNEIMLTITIANNSTLGSASSNMGVISVPITSPVSTVLYLTWSKVNTGATGGAGAPAYTAILTNESHVFAGDISNAIDGSATTQVLAYKGTESQTVTISSVNGKTAGTVDTDTGITGLKFKCSALSGTSPTITFTCTTSFVSANGTIPIVFTVDGVSFTKMFTYSIAFKGATGSIGSQGPTGSAGVPATSYWLISSANVVQKTATGTITVTPSTLTFAGKSQTGTATPTDYACRWIIAYSTDGTNYTNLYTSSANETSKSITVSTEYKTIRARMYLAGGTSTLLDEQIIPIISDGAKGDTGVGVKSVTEYYLATASSSGVTTSTSGWTTAVQTITTDKKYLWNYEVITYTNNTTGTTTPVIIGVFGNTGDTGKGIKSVTEYYLATASSSNVTTSTTGWTTTMQTLTSTKKYLWNYELITYTDDTTTTVNPVIIGVYGDQGTPSVTFQIYAPNGYLLTTEIPSLTLQTFAYEGSTAITSGATFKWYSWVGEAWAVISGATSNSLSVAKTDVLKSNSYKCEMTYKSNVYTATATVEDKTDIYDSLIHVTSKYSPTNNLYWILYSTVYSDEGEKDALLGPISVTAPVAPTADMYWYKIDETNYTVTLMKYSGSAWVTTTDKQIFVYDWFMLNDTNNIVTLGEQSKVKIVTSDKFSRTCSVQCNVADKELVALTHSNQILNDPSDPIVSDNEPVNPINGQLWIKTSANGSYVLSVWDAQNSKWVMSEADTQKKVYVSKPTTYNEGDIWIVAAEYEPDSYIDGVLQQETVEGVTKVVKHIAGTMLIAQYASQTYKDSDWIDALKYTKALEKVNKQMDTYNQFFTFDDTGMTMKAKSLNGQISEFSTKLTNNELGFYQGENKVAYINNNQLNISKAEITNGMTISGTQPILQIGNFAIIQESNGSLSIGLKS